MRRRVRAALELVHAPEVVPFKAPWSDRLPAPVLARLRRADEALLRHIWSLLEDAYGVEADGHEPGLFYSVHRAGDPRNCLVLTPDAATADRIAELWAGMWDVEVSEVCPEHPTPEAYVALAVALHWTPPAWLGAA